LGPRSCGCPPARLSGSSALRTRTMPPGRRVGTGVSAPGTGSAARTPTWRAARGSCSGRSARREAAPADRQARGLTEWQRLGRRLRAEPRSPAPTAAAAALRLQGSSAPQPLLSHGRGALAGRRSGLPAPGSRAPAPLERGHPPRAAAPASLSAPPYAACCAPTGVLRPLGARGAPQPGLAQGRASVGIPGVRRSPTVETQTWPGP
jgi:hypothetical protein